MMALIFTVGESVIWRTNFGIELRADAKIVRVAGGRALIRVLERSPGQHFDHFVERWVQVETLRKS
jgi:hypothetical protein